MLIHLAPRILVGPTSPPCELVGITSLDLDLSLLGGEDVIARRPYTNKLFHVACRKLGRKAVVGILIEAPPMQAFSVTARWSVGLGNSRYIATHRVHYTVLDDEHDAVSDSMITWYGTGNWSSRYPKPRDYCPAASQPRMDAIRDMANRTGDIEDFHDEHSNIIERNEYFSMPTIEPDRLLPSPLFLGDRAPPFEHAFAAGTWSAL